MDNVYNRTGRSCEQCCRPVNNIFLLKTHKCASSTIQNIIMRYGDRKNLSFVLPKEGNYLGHPKPFSKFMLPLDQVPSYGFNILAHHTRYDLTAIKEVMPPDTAFVTILRDPADLFDSMYAYFGLYNYTGASLAQFAEDVDRQNFLRMNRYEDRFGPNQMMFDLGYDSAEKLNSTLMQEALEKIEREFDLVLITEYFNESLILLKNLFCWDTQDIMYFKHNKRKHEGKISTEVRESLQRYNAADMRLYQHFKSKIETLIEAFGKERMKEEVHNLQLWTQLIYQHCVEHMGESDIKETKAYSKDVLSIVLKSDVQGAEQNRMCYDMARAELPYTERLREKQRNFAKSAQLL